MGLFSFVQHLKQLTGRTYEQDPVNLGVVVFVDDSEEFIVNCLDKWSLDFVPFVNGIDMDSLVDDKLSYKLVDGKSLAYIANSNYQIIGFARKRVKSKSIKDEIFTDLRKNEDNILLYHIRFIMNNFRTFMVENMDKLAESSSKKSELGVEAVKEIMTVISDACNTPEDVLIDLREFNKFDGYYFVEIENGRLNFHVNSDISIIFKNGKWKYRDFIITKLLMFELMYLNYFYFYLSEGQLERSVTGINDFVILLKNLSSKKIGSLHTIIDDNLIGEKRYENTERKFRNGVNIGEAEHLIPDDLLSNEPDDIFGSIIKDGDILINISDSDMYFLELISSVDGGVLFDSSLNILRYGSLFRNDLVEKEMSNKMRGARSLAACASSTYGLSFKVSDDGDIELWYRQDLVFSI